MPAPNVPDLPLPLDLLAAAADLKRLPRTGWLFAGIHRPESVADHSYATALLCLALADAIQRDPAGQGLSAPLDVERLLRIALLHDLAEALVTDLPRRTTELLGEATKHAAERRALEQITAGLAAGPDYVALWEEYTASASPEARLVHDADKLEMAHQALQYAHAGVRGLEEFAAERPFYYPLCAALHAALRAAFPA